MLTIHECCIFKNDTILLKITIDYSQGFNNMNDSLYDMPWTIFSSINKTISKNKFQNVQEILGLNGFGKM